MKRILLPLAAALSLLGAGASSAAGSASAGFNVTVTLTSACTVSSPSAVAFTYTSLQTGAATSTGGAFNVKCTNTLPYTVALDATSGSFTTAGLSYSLALSATSGTGNGTTGTAFTVNGTMAANQAGTCATATCSDTSARTVTVSY